MSLVAVFPVSLDNAYRGHVLGLWLFGIVLIVRIGIALGTIFNGREAAQNADGIPLHAFGPEAADAVVALFAIWGLAELVLAALGVLALARYRAMVPLMLGVLLAEHLLRRLLLLVKPIAREGSPPGLWINLGLLAATAAGLALSLVGPRRA